MNSSTNTTESTLDLVAIRGQFPALREVIHGQPLAYLDNAATTQKPQAVLDALTRYYSSENANVHRAVHTLAERATMGYESARLGVQRLLNAPESREIVFVRGTTEAMNLIAHSYGGSTLQPGDEVLVTEMEHHSGIVPWQLICERTGAKLRYIPMDDTGTLILDDLESLLTEKTRILSMVHVSNALGTINPVVELTRRAKALGATVVIDGAQAVPHTRVDVQAIGCDFYCFSGHKIYGPTGIGALWGRAELLEKMPPYQGGGEMIRSVSFEKTTYNTIPHKFEAGTPNIAGAIVLAAAIEWVEAIGLDQIAAHEAALLDYGHQILSDVPGLRMIGTAEEKAAVLSFVLESCHPHDIGTLVDRAGVAIRTGHHCAQPVMDHFDVPATARASLAIYNNTDDLDRLAAALREIVEMFS